MMFLFSRIEPFFFRRISATGFGMMRVSWALTALSFYLMQWSEITFYYSNDGLVTPELGPLLFRQDYRFTILDYVTDPSAVFALYLLLLVCLFFMMIGLRPRLTTILSVVLVCSFQERNLLPLGGGDTVLRLTGFLLAIAPELRACSIGRMGAQWKHWRETGSILPSLEMSIWPYRLLLWQFMVIYATTLWEKLLGTMWWNGTAAAVMLHHPDFMRFSGAWIDVLSGRSVVLGYAALLIQGSWLLLLIPHEAYDRMKIITYGTVKRGVLLGSVLLHGGIWILMTVGSFSPAMLGGFLGLLLDEDFTAFRRFLNRRWSGSIAILFDGRCGFCQRSIFGFLLLDHLQRLQPVNFHDEKMRKAIAPDLTLQDLDNALHARFPDGKILQGFDAFRRIALSVPVFWPMAPLLYLPGVAPVGRRMYMWIARRRKECIREKCRI